MLLGEIPFSPRAKKVLELAVDEAGTMGHYYVGTEHLLLGLLKEEEGIAARVLENLGVKIEDVKEEVINLLGEPTENPLPRSTRLATALPPNQKPRHRLSTSFPGI